MSILCEFPAAPRFIETGTGTGETLAFAMSAYSECHSIEVDVKRYEAAVGKFGHLPYVHLWCGHSPQFLRYLIDPTIKTVFWLDAHYTDRDFRTNDYGNSPVAEELEVIAGQKWREPPVVLIDDFSTFEKALYGWPALETLDAIMVGWRRERLTDPEIFSYRKDEEVQARPPL